MAPDPSRHARAVPGAGLPRRGARARRLLDRHHRPAARPAAGGRRLERRRGAGRRIGHGRRSHGRITALEHKRDGVLEVECRLDAGWRGHQAGQFAFVRFDRREGAHPYTIASAPRPDGAIRFEIKALGDYTSRLPGALRVGQPVEVEGPYGCFQLDADAGAPQVWVAGGIGVTPFLAWLDTWPPTRAVRPARNCTTACATRPPIPSPPRCGNAARPCPRSS
ncbi:FAD-binding oxidoreductase [Achromobacter xylosoxidans]